MRFAIERIERHGTATVVHLRSLTRHDLALRLRAGERVWFGPLPPNWQAVARLAIRMRSALGQPHWTFDTRQQAPPRPAAHPDDDLLAQVEALP